MTQTLEAIAVYTAVELSAELKRLRSGDMTAEQLRAAFEKALLSETVIREELSHKTLKELAPNGVRGGMTKARVIESIYDHMVASLVFMGYSYSPFDGGQLPAQRAALAKVTDAEIQEWVTKRKTEREALVKSLKNPETEDELRTFIGYFSEAKMSPAQKVAWDTFQAARAQTRTDQQRAADAVVEKVELGDIKMTIKEGFHTKHNCKLWIVQLTDRTDRNTFIALCGKARALHGNYSSFGPRDSHGFQFRDMTNAQQFIGLQEKDVDRSEEDREHREEMRENSAVKLRETAQSIIQRAEEKESQPRLTNTAKRAREAGSVEAQCRSDIRMGHTMIRIADAIEAGTANHLRDIRARTHIEELESVLNTAKYKADTKANKRWDETQHRDPTVEDVEQVEVFPWPTLHRDFARNVVTALQDKPGGIMLARKLSRLLEESNANEHVVSFTTDRLDTLQELASKATEHGLREAEMLNNAVSEHGRWKTMGILDVHTLRAALWEYLPLRKPAIRADPIKERMRSLVGVKIDGYFPTPPEVIAKMIDVAELRPGMFVLEPSAGAGHIMDALHEAGVAKDDMECFEINGTLRQILVDKGYAVRGNDFTEYAAEVGRCDRVMMNPPFEDYADISHVVRAFEWLKPGGRLVAITSEGPFFRNDRRSEAFRQWLEAQGGTSEKLESGAFMQSDRPTGVQTRLVVIDKPI